MLLNITSNYLEAFVSRFKEAYGFCRETYQDRESGFLLHTSWVLSNGATYHWKTVTV